MVELHKNNILNKAALVAFLILLVMILAGLPLLVEPREDGIVFTVTALTDAVRNYVSGIPDGSFLLYRTGEVSRSFLETAPPYIAFSFFYLISSGLLGISLGIIFGIAIYRRHMNFTAGVLTFLNNIPDFILIILVQILVVNVTALTGFRIGRIASMTIDKPAILLPVLTLAFYPAIYFMRLVASRTYVVTGEDYVLYAKAKGLKRNVIMRRHVMAAVIPVLRTELHKLCGMMITSLFIAERLFNLLGVTRHMFAYGFTGRRADTLTDYQYTLVVNSLLSLFVLYILMYGIFRLLLLIIEKVATHE